MSELIKPEYRCSQKDLYSILETGWENYKIKLTEFSDHKAMYTATYAVGALAAVAAAKAMPDNAARTTIAETMRVELVELGLICLKNFKKLESYIKTAFPNEDLWEIQFEGAGQDYYAEAANEDWESMQLMMQSGHNYIDTNETLLLGLAPNLNMPATFFAAFDLAASNFNAKYLAFKSAEETGEATAAKVKANNECYNLAINMMADGQLIFSDNAEAKKLFVFNTIWELVNPPVSGVKGSVKVVGTNAPLAGAVVKTQKTGEVAVETLTDIEGSYSKQLSIGDFKLIVIAPGYETQTLDVTMKATGYKTFDFEMVAV